MTYKWCYGPRSTVRIPKSFHNDSLSPTGSAMQDHLGRSLPSPLPPYIYMDLRVVRSGTSPHQLNQKDVS